MPVRRQRYAPIVDLAYSAALGERSWQEWAVEAMHAFDGTGGVAGIVDVARGEIVQVVGAEGPPKAAEEYVAGQYRFDPQVGVVQRFQGGGTYVDWGDLDPEAPEVRDYARWHYSAGGLAHHLTAVIPLDDDRHRFALCIHQAKSADSSPLANRREITTLLPELGRVMTLAFRQGELLLDAYWNGTRADADERGAFLLDERGRVLRLNAAAEALVARGDSVILSGGWLGCRAAASHAALGALIARAVAREGGRSGGLRIERPLRMPPLLAMCHPLPRLSRGLAPAEAAALLTIADPSARALGRSDVHREVFRLTRREGDLAAALLQGHSVESAAATLEIGIATARSHMRRLFAKTGATGQVELLRLLDRMR